MFARDLALLPDEAAWSPSAPAAWTRAQASPTATGSRARTARYAELAADPDVDVVYVASPHHDHLARARLCLEAGKAVLVEKPLTVTAADTEELIDLARDRGTVLDGGRVDAHQPADPPGGRARRRRRDRRGPPLSADFGFAFDGPDTHRLLDPAQAGGAILDAGVYPVARRQPVPRRADELFGFGPRGHRRRQPRRRPADLSGRPTSRPAATATVLCSWDAICRPGSQVYGTAGRIMIDDFFIRPAEMTVYRGIERDAEPEVLVTQWPGGGYTFQAQEVMRCLRAGELESPLVPWARHARRRADARPLAGGGRRCRSTGRRLAPEDLDAAADRSDPAVRLGLADASSPNCSGPSRPASRRPSCGSARIRSAPSMVDGEPAGRAGRQPTRTAWSARPVRGVRGPTALPDEGAGRRPAAVACRRTRHGPRPRRGYAREQAAGRRRGTPRTGSTATAGRSRRCCAR